MTKKRQDAWTEEEDLLLAETVLRHVREGSTQLNAFEEVGDKLNRTSAACGFRWNAVVRQQYEESLQMAKKFRKQRQRALGNKHALRKRPLYTPPVPSLEELGMEPLEVQTNEYEHVETSHLTLDHVIAFLHSLKQSYIGQETALVENKQLKLELEQLQQQYKQLEQQFTKLQKENEELRGDYETMARIINRARQIEISEDEFKAPIFKMDRNGNLEKIEKIAE